jgi:predicted Zn-dependent protease
MAIDKSRTSPFMKTMIILLAGTFVLGIGFTGLTSLSSCTASAPLLPSSSTSTESTASVATINAKYSPAVKTREASITADPKNYTLLVAQANGYYDWASALLQAASTETTADLELWQSSATYYERALKIKPGDTSVTTDYSITLFYSGDVTKAISVGEKLRAANPKFAAIVYNLGVFYANSGTSDANAKAIAAFNAYLKLEPSGTNATNAKQLITQLSSTTTSTTGQ